MTSRGLFITFEGVKGVEKHKYRFLSIGGINCLTLKLSLLPESRVGAGGWID